MNNDVTLDRGALRELASHRAARPVLVERADLPAKRRRPARGNGIHRLVRRPIGCARLSRADVPSDGRRASRISPAAAAPRCSARAPLTRYVRESRCYDPFYWEDIEWGVRAWRDGFDVLFCPAAHAFHRHRATTARFYAAAEIDRIVARNARSVRCAQSREPLRRRVADGPRLRSAVRKPARAGARDDRVGRASSAHRGARGRSARRRRCSPIPLPAHDRARILVQLSAARRRRDELELRVRVCWSSRRSRYFRPDTAARGASPDCSRHLRRDFDIVLVTRRGLAVRRAELRRIRRTARRVSRPARRRRADEPVGRARCAHAHARASGAARSGRAGDRRAPARESCRSSTRSWRRWSSCGRRVSAGFSTSTTHTGRRTSHAPDAAERFARQRVAAYDAVMVCSDEDRAADRSSQRRLRAERAAASSCVAIDPRLGAAAVHGPVSIRAEPRRRRAISLPTRSRRSARPSRTPASRILGGDGAASKVDGDAAFAQPGVDVVAPSRRRACAARRERADDQPADRNTRLVDQGGRIADRRPCLREHRRRRARLRGRRLRADS